MGAAAGPSTHTLVASALKPLTQESRPFERLVQLAAANQDIGQRGVWGVVHPAAETQFFFVESRKVMAGGVLDRIVILKISLQHNFSRRLSAPGASGDLSEQLKRALGGTKIRKA